MAGNAGPRLDDADGVTGLAVTNFQVGQEEVVDQLGYGGVIVPGNGVVEVHGRLGDEVEYRR